MILVNYVNTFIDLYFQIPAVLRFTGTTAVIALVLLVCFLFGVPRFTDPLVLTYK